MCLLDQGLVSGIAYSPQSPDYEKPTTVPFGNFVGDDFTNLSKVARLCFQPTVARERPTQNPNKSQWNTLKRFNEWKLVYTSGDDGNLGAKYLTMVQQLPRLYPSSHP